MEPEGSLPHSQVSATCPDPRHAFTFRNKAGFYGEVTSALRPAPKLEDHPFSAVCDRLFNIFATNLHTEDRSSIRNLRTGHAVVTGTHLSREWGCTAVISIFVLLYFALLTSFNFHLRKLQTYRCTDLYIDIFQTNFVELHHVSTSYITYLPSFGEPCCPIFNVQVASDDRCNSFIQNVGNFLLNCTASHTFHSACLSACPQSQKKVSGPRVRREEENEEPALFIYLFIYPDYLTTPSLALNIYYV